MRQRDLPRTRTRPAADQRRQQGGVMRIAEWPLARQLAAAQPTATDWIMPSSSASGIR